MLSPQDKKAEASAAPANPLEQLSLADLRQRTSWKWQTYAEDVLPLWVAEMDVPLAPHIASALHQAIEVGDTGYPVGTALAEAFSGFADRRWGWNTIDVARTAVVPDVMTGMFEVICSLTSPGDIVVVNPPVYSPFYTYTAHASREILEAPLGKNLRIDLGALEEAFRHVNVRGKRAVYLLSNPHNPTGVVHTREELSAVALLAREYGVRVVSDEIHGPLVLPGAQFTPLLTVPGAENAFSVTSASKAWNLAGLKAGLVVAGAEASAQREVVPAWLGRGASHLGVIAHTVAFQTGGAWLDALIEGLDSNRALLGRLLKEHLPTVGYQPPEGTFLAWLDCTDLDVEQATGDKTDGPSAFTDLMGPTKLFHDQARVALSSGEVFGPGGANHVRLNFATSQAVLTEAVTRMGEAVRRRP
ncbi:aminotransferase class I/II-fold pyridoxal phosphate-dependent enzyme [Streptomyces sp. NPDC004237]|uniref:MalY/PatB family protein n=1 Tax=Streptomyces sp. NPDC004237 TaxID=3154455 RepID=UPI0033B76724